MVTDDLGSEVYSSDLEDEADSDFEVESTRNTGARSTGRRRSGAPGVAGGLGLAGWLAGRLSLLLCAPGCWLGGTINLPVFCSKEAPGAARSWEHRPPETLQGWLCCRCCPSAVRAGQEAQQGVQVKEGKEGAKWVAQLEAAAGSTQS